MKAVTAETVRATSVIQTLIEQEGSRVLDSQANI